MTWNWQQADWPKFTYERADLEPLETSFRLSCDAFIKVFQDVSADEQNMLRVELISEEALKTSEIEGEKFNRERLQSSLRQQIGLEDINSQASPEERGITEMMMALYRSFAEPLSHNMLASWHKMVMAGHNRLQVVGDYRKHAEPMQVVSGYISNPIVHFEAPPSARMQDEMTAFIRWFNDTAPDGKTPLPALTRAGITHLYFETIHPFEDGNGRIGRALSQKALAQSLGQPSLIALSYTIERQGNRYYEMLECSNKDNEITDWLIYFAETILDAQRNTMMQIEFYIAKTRLCERLNGRLNPRQEKVVARMLREGIEGFKGGLSAKNYISITGTNRQLATSDLNEMVEIGALTQTGEERNARYHLNLSRTNDTGYAS